MVFGFDYNRMKKPDNEKRCYADNDSVKVHIFPSTPKSLEKYTQSFTLVNIFYAHVDIYAELKYN
jgi:hypothetical protein